MKKIIFIGFFLFSYVAFSQTNDEDVNLNDVLDELFDMDSSLVDFDR